MTEIKAPNKYDLKEYNLSIFLTGSIEQGKATRWQKQAVEYFKDDEDILLLNPRRDDYDKNQEQSIDNPYFKEQVAWELDAQDNCNVILMYFDPKTKSPITLLELGLYALKFEIYVCCPKEYWRRGNVEIVCERYEIPFFEDLNSMLEAIRENYLK